MINLKSKLYTISYVTQLLSGRVGRTVLSGQSYQDSVLITGPDCKTRSNDMHVNCHLLTHFRWFFFNPHRRDWEKTGHESKLWPKVASKNRIKIPNFGLISNSGLPGLQEQVKIDLTLVPISE